MKIGDEVKIKSYEEIKAGHTEEISYGFYTGKHFFDFSMKHFCGRTEKIKQSVHKEFGDVHRLDNGWWWLDKWLIPKEFFSTEDFDI